MNDGPGTEEKEEELALCCHRQQKGLRGSRELDPSLWGCRVATATTAQGSPEPGAPGGALSPHSMSRVGCESSWDGEGLCELEPRRVSHCEFDIESNPSLELIEEGLN